MFLDKIGRGWIVRGSVCLLLIGLVCLASPRFLPQAQSAPAEISPQFSKCILELDGRTATPTRVLKPWVLERRVGDRRFVVTKDLVEERDAKEDRALWSIKSPDGKRLQWLGASANVALFQGFQQTDEAKSPTPDTPLRLRRLDLASKQWLAPLEMPAEEKDSKQSDEIVAVLADAGRVIVLTQQSVAGERRRETKATTYRLTCFRGGQEKLVWSRTFRSRGTRPAPGVYLWASAMPDFAAADIQHLSWLGDHLLVCADEKEDLLCLDADGKTSWRVARVWEFQRGFIGPSVWSHYIGRVGTGDFEGAFSQKDQVEDDPPQKPQSPEEKKRHDEEVSQITKAREEFDKRFQCAIVGGPVVVRRPKRGGDDFDDSRVLVAVAKGPNDWNWGYLSDCIIYELSAGGRVTQMTSLPRMVIGSQYGVTEDGVVWGCQQRAMARIGVPRPASDFPIIFGGPGGPDMLASVDWYRQFSAAKPKAWFSAGKVTDATAFGAKHAFRSVAGGYVADKKDKVYCFPISIVDLSTGMERSATLRVPFSGDLKLPDTNVSRFDDQTEASGPYLLGITQLRVDGNLLEVTLGMEGSAIGITFDTAPLLSAAPR